MARTQSKDSKNLPAEPRKPIDYTAALREHGLIEERQASDVVRLKLNGNNFYVGDELIAVYNPLTQQPALRVQIVDAPNQLQSMWFPEDGELADFVERPEIAGTMCRSYYNIPTQARRRAEDGTECRSCPVNPFTRAEQLPREADGQKCKWKGELQVRLLKDDNTPVTEQVFTVSMPTTAMIEWQGTSREPEKGYTRPLNFMQLLVRLGEEQAEDDEDSRRAGVNKAMTALGMAGVIAEVRAPQHKLQNGNTFNVISFTPIDIADVEVPDLIGDPDPDNEDVELPF